MLWTQVCYALAGGPSPRLQHKKGFQEGGFLSAHDFSGNLIIILLAEESLLEKNASQF
jgi:hypothetical protein